MYDFDVCDIHHVRKVQREQYGAATCPMCRNEREMADKADETNWLLSEQGQRETKRLELQREEAEAARKRIEAEGVCGRCGQRFIEKTRRRQQPGEAWTGTLEGFIEEGVCPNCYFARTDAKEVRVWTEVEWQGHLLQRLGEVATLDDARRLAQECRERGQEVAAERAETRVADILARQRLDQAEDARATQVLANELREQGRLALASEAEELARARGARELEASLRARLVRLERARDALLLRDEVQRQGLDALSGEVEGVRVRLAAKETERLRASVRIAIRYPESEREAQDTSDQMRSMGLLEDADDVMRNWAKREPAIRRFTQLTTVLKVLQLWDGASVETLAEQEISEWIFEKVVDEAPTVGRRLFKHDERERGQVPEVRMAGRGYVEQEVLNAVSVIKKQGPAIALKLAQGVVAAQVSQIKLDPEVEGSYGRALARWRDLLAFAGGSPTLRAAITEGLAGRWAEEKDAVTRVLIGQMRRTLATEGSPRGE